MASSFGPLMLCALVLLSIVVASVAQGNRKLGGYGDGDGDGDGDGEYGSERASYPGDVGPDYGPFVGYGGDGNDHGDYPGGHGYYKGGKGYKKYYKGYNKYGKYGKYYKKWYKYGGRDGYGYGGRDDGYYPGHY